MKTKERSMPSAISHPRSADATTRHDDDAEWKTMYNQLKAYKVNHGNCLVPRSNQKLCSWVSSQRELNRTKQLKPERKKLLNHLNFSWTDWNIMYHRLQVFYNHFRHTRVPRDYHDQVLVMWVNQQRNIKGVMTKVQKEKLNALDFFSKDHLPIDTTRRQQEPEDASASATEEKSRSNVTSSILLQRESPDQPGFLDDRDQTMEHSESSSSIDSGSQPPSLEATEKDKNSNSPMRQQSLEPFIPKGSDQKGGSKRDAEPKKRASFKKSSFKVVKSSEQQRSPLVDESNKEDGTRPRNNTDGGAAGRNSKLPAESKCVICGEDLYSKPYCEFESTPREPMAIAMHPFCGLTVGQAQQFVNKGQYAIKSIKRVYRKHQDKDKDLLDRAVILTRTATERDIKAAASEKPAMEYYIERELLQNYDLVKRLYADACSQPNAEDSQEVTVNSKTSALVQLDKLIGDWNLVQGASKDSTAIDVIDLVDETMAQEKHPSTSQCSPTKVSVRSPIRSGKTTGASKVANHSDKTDMLPCDTLDTGDKKKQVTQVAKALDSESASDTRNVGSHAPTRKKRPSRKSVGTKLYDDTDSDSSDGSWEDLAETRNNSSKDEDSYSPSSDDDSVLADARKEFETKKDVGSRVYCRYLDGSYYWGTVKKKSKQKDSCQFLYSVKFDDGDYLDGVESQFVYTVEACRDKFSLKVPPTPPKRRKTVGVDRDGNVDETTVGLTLGSRVSCCVGIGSWEWCTVTDRSGDGTFSVEFDDGGALSDVKKHELRSCDAMSGVDVQNDEAQSCNAMSYAEGKKHEMRTCKSPSPLKKVVETCRPTGSENVVGSTEPEKRPRRGAAKTNYREDQDDMDDDDLIGRGVCQVWTDVHGRNKVVYGAITGREGGHADEDSFRYIVTYTPEARSLINAMESTSGSVVPRCRRMKPTVAYGGCLTFDRKVNPRTTTANRLLTKDLSVLCWTWITPDTRREELVEINGTTLPRLTLVVRGFLLVFAVKESTIPNAGNGVFVTATPLVPRSTENGKKAHSSDFVLRQGEFLDMGIYAPLRDADRRTERVFFVKSFVLSYKCEELCFNTEDEDFLFDIANDSTGDAHDVAKQHIPIYLNECKNEEIPWVRAEHDPEGNVHYLLGKNESNLTLPGDGATETEIFVNYGDTYENVRLRKGYSELPDHVKEARLEELKLEDNQYLKEMTMFSAEEIAASLDYLHQVMFGCLNKSVIARVPEENRRRALAVLEVFKKRAEAMLSTGQHSGGVDMKRQVGIISDLIPCLVESLEDKSQA